MGRGRLRRVLFVYRSAAGPCPRGGKGRFSSQALPTPFIVNRALPTIYNSHLAGRRDTSLTDAGGRSRLTLRGFWVGAFLSFFLAIGAPYTNMAMRSTNMAFDFNTPGAIFLFLVLTKISMK